MSPLHYTFKRSERLKKRKYIETLFRQGKAFSFFPFKCYYIFPADSGRNTGLMSPTHIQTGVSIPKKRVRKATQRNLVKRRALESWRLSKHALEEKVLVQNLHLHIFFVYQSSKIEDYRTICLAVQKITHKLESLIAPSSTDSQ